MSTHLLLFARYPEPGRVKTRLAATTSDAFAAELYAFCFGRVRASLAAVQAVRTVWVADAADVDRMSELVGSSWRVRPQPVGDLTRRLQAAFQRAFAEGATRVIVTATDTPGLDAARVRTAVAALDEHDAVLGPASDGGYWLLGLTRPLDAVFEGIDWSTEVVADQTRARLDAAGRSWAELDVLPDVDVEDDLRDWVRDHPDDALTAWVIEDGRLG